MNKFCYIGLTTTAIAMTMAPVAAEENLNKNAAETIFVCTTENTASTMYAHTPGNAMLTPLIGWHQDYLLKGASSGEVCQQVANKLQGLSEADKEWFISTQKQPNHSVVCMVSNEEGSCDSADSEKLFKVNANYSPNCVLNRLEPLECTATIVRGGILSVPDSPYQPIWWPW